MTVKPLTSIACFLLALTGVVWAQTVVVPYTGHGADIPMAVIRQNMMGDPNLLAKVAQAEGMTPARFMGQGEGRIMEQVRKYLSTQPNVKEQQPSASEAMKTRK